MDNTTDNQFAHIIPDIPAKPWRNTELPKRILVIRLQATGDMVAALPYIQYLKRSLPKTVRIDLLTREEVEAIPHNIELFNNVYSIAGGRNFKKQFFFAAAMLPQLLLHRYDVVIDLQNNEISGLVRRSLMPKAWSAFDRFSPIPAGERYRLTIEAIGLGHNGADNNFILKPIHGIMDLLTRNGWNGSNSLIIINPAGAFQTRNWPLTNYVQFMKLWLQHLPEAQFLILGLDVIAEKAAYLKEMLGGNLVNLVNKTSVEEAFAIAQKAKFVLSEDSGLMHMAWVSGIPTLALFGATRSDWARPLGKHTDFVDSSDLSCGNCMREICKYGDNRCLTRYSPEFIFSRANALLNSLVQKETASPCW
ncbi:MAG TPA: glycosyltransferase family 9 protein [Mucilaginibacter sp.]|jgi:ADP-heptose:LPS heptosyltransferase|nr:glycosyltransferase family 9 protein [Mucilaginibacter sp.]